MPNLNILIYLFLLTQLMACGGGAGDGGSGIENQGQNSSDTTPYVSKIFNVKDAKAVLTVSSAQNNALTKEVSAMTAVESNDILKIDNAGHYQSIIDKVHPTWHLRISVVETGPDGSLYIGLSQGVWIYDDTYNTENSDNPDFTRPPLGRNVALFRIYPSGKTEVVDPDIQSMANFPSSSLFPGKTIQFDDEGNVFYLGSSNNTTVLKRKSIDGKITQIGNSRMEVRDFLIAPNGTILFHGSNQGDWDTEWLRLYNTDESVTNLYYRDGGGWLRAYYVDQANNVVLVGDDLPLGNNQSQVKRYSGIMRANILKGEVISIDSLLDDKNMYQDNGSQIGNQVVYGYWEDGSYHSFFGQDEYSGNVIQPTTFASGLNNEDVMNYIRRKYVNIDQTGDQLDKINFSGLYEERLPVYVEKDLFESLRDLMTLDEKKLVDSQYTLDLNANPNRYVYSDLTPSGSNETNQLVAMIFTRFWENGIIDLDYVDPSEGLASIWHINGLSEKITRVIQEHIPEQAKTWQTWREENGLNGVSFSWSKQILVSDLGKLYVVIKLDSWGSTESRGDRIYQMLDQNGELALVAFKQHSKFKTITKAKIYGQYLVYISNVLGLSKIFKLDLTDPSKEPVDLIPNRTNIEILSFNFDPTKNMLMYDIYDLNNNKSYLVQQKLTSGNIEEERTFGSQSITDVVPFVSK